MIKIIQFKKVLTILLIIGYSLTASDIFAAVDSKVAVHYRPDGGVSITYFVNAFCNFQESEESCINRAIQKGTNKDFPYDIIPKDQIPTDRKDRDKWRGAKGQGIWIDYSLVTKSQRIKELRVALKNELNKVNPDIITAMRLRNNLDEIIELKDGSSDLNYGVLSSIKAQELSVENATKLGSIKSEVNKKILVKINEVGFWTRLWNWFKGL